MGEPGREVTRLLAELRDGDKSASERLLPLVYDQLRGLAAAVFAGQRDGHTLQPTALVEAWLKLAGNLGSIEDRRHFLVVASKAMRQVITDHARGRQRAKRGGGVGRVTLDLNFAGRGSELDLVDLADCLGRLAERNAPHAQVVELRLFSGLSIDETAQVLGLSPRTVDSDWAMAKAWLRKELAATG
jgi:RNA polymerase sigma factor (TIGR02999 family)